MSNLLIKILCGGVKTSSSASGIASPCCLRNSKLPPDVLIISRRPENAYHKYVIFCYFCYFFGDYSEPGLQAWNSWLSYVN